MTHPHPAISPDWAGYRDAQTAATVFDVPGRLRLLSPLGAHMNSVNMHDAKTHFSRLVDRAAGGETIIIAKAGRPVARLTPLDAVPGMRKRRLGFLAGYATVPDDFDTMERDEIIRLFEGDDDLPA